MASGAYIADQDVKVLPMHEIRVARIEICIKFNYVLTPGVGCDTDDAVRSNMRCTRV